MTKKCAVCGTECAEAAAFCSFCGEASFEAAEEVLREAPKPSPKLSRLPKAEKS